MAIYEQHNQLDEWGQSEFTAYCDRPGCEADFEVLEAPFRDFIEQMKDAGWRIKKVGLGWEHACPDCVTASKEEADDA